MDAITKRKLIKLHRKYTPKVVIGVYLLGLLVLWQAVARVDNDDWAGRVATNRQALR